jgi:hypothetical protein
MNMPDRAKTSKMELSMRKYEGKRMFFRTKEGDFEGTVEGVIWLGSPFIELSSPISLFNGHQIIFGKEVVEE